MKSIDQPTFQIIPKNLNIEESKPNIFRKTYKKPKFWYSSDYHQGIPTKISGIRIPCPDNNEINDLTSELELDLFIRSCMAELNIRMDTYISRVSSDPYSTSIKKYRIDVGEYNKWPGVVQKAMDRIMDFDQAGGYIRLLEDHRDSRHSYNGLLISIDRLTNLYSYKNRPFRVYINMSGGHMSQSNSKLIGITDKENVAVQFANKYINEYADTYLNRLDPRQNEARLQIGVYRYMEPTFLYYQRY